jgi:hypothetical protein
MSKIEVNAIEPQSGTTLTVGASGDTVTVPSGVTFDASNATTTLPSNVVTTTGTQTLTNKTIDASQLTDSTISLAKLSATGTKDATTFLRGDNSFAEAGGGKVLQVVSTHLRLIHFLLHQLLLQILLDYQYQLLHLLHQVKLWF